MLLHSRVVRLRASTKVDGYGDTVEDWAAPARRTFLHADVQEVDSVEENGATRRLVTGRRRCAIRGAVDLTARDRLEVDGEAWQIDGDPVVLRPRLGVPLTTVELRRITG